MPEKLPSGVKTQELPESAMTSHRYRLSCPSAKVADGLALRLREDGMMFATQVKEVNPWFKSIIAPNEGKGSVIFNIFWVFAFMAMSAGVIHLLNHLRQNEELMGHVRDSMSLFSSWGK